MAKTFRRVALALFMFLSIALWFVKPRSEAALTNSLLSAAVMCLLSIAFDIGNSAESKRVTPDPERTTS